MDDAKAASLAGFSQNGTKVEVLPKQVPAGLRVGDEFGEVKK
jgi:hypothetical protein